MDACRGKIKLRTLPATDEQSLNPLGAIAPLASYIGKVRARAGLALDSGAFARGCCVHWRYVILLLEHIVVTSLPPRIRLRKPGVPGPRIVDDPRYHVVVFSHQEMWMQFSMAFSPGQAPAGTTPVIAMPAIAAPGSLMGNRGCACCAY
jgi:hypothetical protein